MMIINLLKKFKIPILMLAFFALWVCLFYLFIFKKIGLFPDGYSYFHWIKFYFDSIASGVYPLWHPFRAWGMPVGYKIRFIGEFNPFLWLPFSLYMAGIKYSTAYFIYAVSYYFLGLVGFYLLSKRFFQDTFLAFCAFLLLMFSSSGIPVFFNYCEVVLNVPSIWFFYFLYSFFQTFEKRFFLGLTFCLMIIMITYMPFYFLTIFLVMALGFSCLYPRKTLELVSKIFAFAKQHKLLFCFCIFGVLLSIIPGFVWYQEAGQGEFSFTHRYSESTESNAATLGFKMISLGGLVGPLTFKKLFSGLMYMKNNLSYFFISIFAYLIVLLSVFTKMNRKSILFFGTGFFMLLLSLTYVLGLYQFLYDRIYYFKLIRNIFYLLYMAMPFIVLFVVEQFRLLLDDQPNNVPKKFVTLLFIILIHGGFAYFLFDLGYIVVMSYVTIALSFLIFSAYYLGLFTKSSSVFKILIIIAIIIQPVQVLLHYNQNVANRGAGSYDDNRKYSKFSYSRFKSSGPVRVSEDAIYESDGFMKAYYSGVSWSRVLLKTYEKEAIEDYISRKFIVYDRIKLIDDQNIDWKELGLNLITKANLAYVFREGSKGDEIIDSLGAASRALVMSEDTDQFKVTDFGLNHIQFETNFPQRKFLVYNDSYHSKWRAMINDEPGRVYRANVGFKGIWLEPGENTVFMRYDSIWTERFYFFLSAFFVLFFVLVLREFIPQRKEEHAQF